MSPEFFWTVENGVPVHRAWARALRAREVPAPTRALALERLAFVARKNAWLPVPLDDRWVAAYRLTVQRGAVVVAEVRVFPLEQDHGSQPGTWSAEVLGITASVPEGGITSRLLRRVKVGEHHRLADAVLRRSANRAPMAVDLEPRQAPGPGRPRKPDLWYARAAQAYIRALGRRSRHPIRDAAETLGMTPARVRDVIHRARERDLLTPGVQGQRGGALTPRALALLEGRTRHRRRAPKQPRTRTSPTKRRA